MVLVQSKNPVRIDRWTGVVIHPAPWPPGSEVARDVLVLKFTYPCDPRKVSNAMTSEPETNERYLRGTTKLAVDALVGVVDLVEAMHRRISTFGGLFADGDLKRTSGLTGFVYSNIRIMAMLLGDGVDVALDRFASELGEIESSQTRQALLAALNGVIGDYLEETHNPLAIDMKLRQHGEPWTVDKKALQQSGGRVLLMIHGSCGNDLQWLRKNHNHGAKLAEEFRFVPVYLHYNSGRHISENGSDLSDLLEAVVTEYPAIQELTVLVHSMGGLVARSACFYAQKTDCTWQHKLNKLFFLATPHHGALLEKSGNWVDHLLQVNTYSAPISRLGKIRSAGVTDLRYGNLCHRDWQGRGRFKRGPDRRCPVPLPQDTDCYTVAATTGGSPGHVTDHIVGDGLVQLHSALGHHEDPDKALAFPESHQLTLRNLSHLDVLCDPRVYEALQEWIAE